MDGSGQFLKHPLLITWLGRGIARVDKMKSLEVKERGALLTGQPVGLNNLISSAG